MRHRNRLAFRKTEERLGRPDPTPGNVLRPVEHPARIPDDEDAFSFTMLPLRRVDLEWIHVAEVDTPAALLRDASRKGDLDSRFLNSPGRVVRSRAFDVSAVRLDHAGDRGETIGLFREVLEHVIPDLVDQASLHIRNLA